MLGIDLGTTYSAMAWFNRHGAPEIISNSEGERTTPSVIFFEPGGAPLVGEVARNQVLADPARAVQFIKREMGNTSFRLNIDGEAHYPEDLSAQILRKLREDASAFLETEITQAVISVPAYFGDAQRAATQTAGSIAGLEVLNTINEPTAAALAYGYGKEPTKSTLMVYDFGGGTFDVTIMRIEGNEFTVLSTDGDSHLGGLDVDHAVATYLAEQFKAHQGIDLRDSLDTNTDLIRRAEDAKRGLFGRTSVTVTLSAQGKSMRIDLDRTQLRALITDLLEKTARCMEEALAGAKLNWGGVDRILLVGGSSRLAAVSELVQRVSGREPSRDANPDELVARGAAIQAALTIARESRSSPAGQTAQTPPDIDLIVHDVAPHSLGIKAATSDGTAVNSIIIKRFTPVPCERKRVYRTVRDHQDSVQIEVLQGEDQDPFSPALEVIGRAGLAGLPARPAGEVAVAITLSYDENGVVAVLAQELSSGGQSIRQELMQKSAALDPAIVEEMRDRLANQDEADHPAATDDRASGAGPQPSEFDADDAAEPTDEGGAGTVDEVVIGHDGAQTAGGEPNDVAPLEATSGADVPSWNGSPSADAEEATPPEDGP